MKYPILALSALLLSAALASAHPVPVTASAQYPQQVQQLQSVQTYSQQVQVRQLAVQQYPQAVSVQACAPQVQLASAQVYPSAAVVRQKTVARASVYGAGRYVGIAGRGFYIGRRGGWR